MLLIPAVDIKDGRCVRLVQGDMNAETVYSDDPFSQVKRWIDLGAKRVHIVDLNGAVEGRPVNAELIGSISLRYPNIEFQVGGGIRDVETAALYLDCGINFVIIGTQAIQNPRFVKQVDQMFPGSVIAGLDVNRGKLATEGWLGEADENVVDVARNLQGKGAVAVVYTDIQRDGMLSGVNVKATAALADQINIPVIASGGIKDLNDIEDLLKVSHLGIYGAIAGKSLYEGTLDFTQATKLINEKLTDRV